MSRNYLKGPIKKSDHTVDACAAKLDGSQTVLITSAYRPSGKVSILHSVDRPGKVSPSAEVLAKCNADWQTDKIEVVDHRSNRLRNKKSLEALRGAFGEGKIEYDPTGTFKRIDGLVALAGSLRKALPKAVSKLGYESSRQTLYVILDASIKERSIAAIRDLVLIVTGVAETWRRTTRPDTVSAIRVGFELPLGTELVPVDNASLPLGPWTRFKRVGMSARKLLGMATFFGFSALVGPAAAAPTATLDIARSSMVSIEQDRGTDAQDFWSDPTYSLLGVPEVPNRQKLRPARRIAQSLEWLVNAPQQGGSDAAPIDVRYYSRSDLIELQGGGFLSKDQGSPSAGVWAPAFKSVVDLSQPRDQVLLGAENEVLLWLLRLFGFDTADALSTLPQEDVTQGYIG